MLHYRRTTMLTMVMAFGLHIANTAKADKRAWDIDADEAAKESQAVVSKKRSASESAKALTTTQPLLADVAARAPCDVTSLNGKAVTFGKTEIPPSVDISKIDLCKEAGSLVDYTYTEEKLILQEFCAPAKKIVAESFDGDWDRAFEVISDRGFKVLSDMSVSSDIKAGVAANFIKMCRSKEGIMNRQKTSAQVNHIHSIGQFTLKGKPCIGALVSSKNTTSVIFNLVELTGCTGKIRKLKYDNGYHPISNPTGVREGDYVKNEMHYDGDVPATFKYEGTEYKMFSTPADSTTAR